MDVINEVLTVTDHIGNLSFIEATLLCISEPNRYVLRNDNFAPNIFVVYEVDSNSFFVKQFKSLSFRDFSPKLHWMVTYTTPSSKYTVYDVRSLVENFSFVDAKEK